MCNLYTQTKSVEELRQLFAEREMVLTFPDGAPNLRPGEIRISDNAPIVRAATGAPGAYELSLTLVQEHFAWLDEIDARCTARLPAKVMAAS